MDLWQFFSFLSIFALVVWMRVIKGDDPMLCIKQSPNMCRPRARRYDVRDMGYKQHFHGWVDVQGQGAANDYCRIVGDEPNLHLSCALAGTHGESDKNYDSATSGFDIGHSNTWYMKDEDGDGRDDYCRCIGNDKAGFDIICTKAGSVGFYGSETQGGLTNTFPVISNIRCKQRQVRQEFGREYITK